jgi:hypothetical protein
VAVWTWHKRSARCIVLACAMLAVSGVVLVLDRNVFLLAGLGCLLVAGTLVNQHVVKV